MPGGRRWFGPFPYDSTVSGMHTNPSCEHLGSFMLCFLDSASSDAAPSDKLAAFRISNDKGEVTVMSMATHFPLFQVHPLAVHHCKTAARDA